MMGIVVAVLLLGGGAFAAWYVIKGGEKRQAATGIDAPKPAFAVGVDAAQVAVVDAAEAVAVDGPAAGSGSGSDTGSGATVGSGSAAGSGSNTEIEMEPDPTKVEHVAPQAPDREDEVEDSPTKDEEIEKRAPPAPVLAKTIPEVLALIKEGKAELAITSLRNLAKYNPKNAYIPFLLGNVYFDKGWWLVTMPLYAEAISKNAGYRDNGILNRNVIKMMASPKIRYNAELFIRRHLGKSAVPWLKQAAAVERNAYVKKRAGELAKSIR
jgi:hypothetical protein